MGTEPRFTRSSTGILAGVCKGLAERFQIDVMLVRILFIASVIFFGVGICFYILLAVSFPRQDQLDRAYDTRIMGVCARLALRFDFDIGLVRLLTLIVFLSSLGSTLLFYVILYFVLPTRNELHKA
ncbi:MAG: PspC domain-containing protein [Bdellovibrionota bacterium]